jgi:hypothetical protein
MTTLTSQQLEELDRWLQPKCKRSGQWPWVCFIRVERIKSRFTVILTLHLYACLVIVLGLYNEDTKL